MAKRFAQHLCQKHCPVLAECEEDSRRFSYQGIVAGGIIWSEKPGIPIRTKRAFVACELDHSHTLVDIAQAA